MRTSGRMVVIAALVALGGFPARAADTIVIGSKNFTENRILAQVLALLVEEHTALEVEVRDGLGGTLVVFEALRAGEIDVYPEYTGTGWALVLQEAARATDPLRTYVHVAREYRRRFGIRWLAPFGFSNSYALALRGDVAERLGVTRVSELLGHAEGLVAGVSHEFLSREDGWPGVSEAYGLELADVRGMEHGLAFEAIDSGEIDLIDAWTTDGKLLRFDLRVLEDDLGFWPPYHGAPIVREEVLARHPDLAAVIERLAFRLPDERMQQLNYEVEVERRAFRDVARAFLEDEGLIGALTADADEGFAAGERRGDLLTFLRGRIGVTLELTLEHLVLTVGAVLAAILFAVPLGILLTRSVATAQFVLGLAGVVQTVPSLAMLAFMIPLLGLGLWAAYAALFLYALLPILRNTYTGVREVDPALREAAVGMGMRPRQVLLLVELPLAARTIMAGIRTSTVITIGVATLAAFIGAGGLGDPIVTGLQLNDKRLVLAGAIPAALLALVADLALQLVERLVAPRLA